MGRIDGHRSQLNDFVQRKYGGTKKVKWDESESGPEHQPTWEFRANLDGYEIGRGQGLSKGAAKEAAAARALEYLRSREGTYPLWRKDNILNSGPFEAKFDEWKDLTPYTQQSTRNTGSDRVGSSTSVLEGKY
ncbi:hypothetical protein EV401DRAFT_1892991 [Pisolithus croceorrhizus]|nr:hypothetical protein EV401DRAFT_1892991 [Pisolithus croceorrhizus]